MSADEDIDLWLASRGYGLAPVRDQARATLEGAQLTRAGKKRMSTEKLGRAQELLGSTYALHCSAPECRAHAERSGRTPLLADPKSACERCGGSSNARAETELLEACRAKGVHKLVIVGGSPAVREELERALGKSLSLRMIDGTERRSADRAKADLEWADLVLIWGASELDHKVSTLYTHGHPSTRARVVHVPKRGVAALLAGGIEHLRKR